MSKDLFGFINEQVTDNEPAVSNKTKTLRELFKVRNKLSELDDTVSSLIKAIMEEDKPIPVNPNPCSEVLLEEKTPNRKLKVVLAPSTEQFTTNRPGARKALLDINPEYMIPDLSHIDDVHLLMSGGMSELNPRVWVIVDEGRLILLDILKEVEVGGFWTLDNEVTGWFLTLKHNQ